MINQTLFELRAFSKIIKVLEKKEHTMSAIHKKTAIFYSHVSNIVNQLEEKGLVDSVKTGRCRKISLTYKGNQLLRNIYEMEDLLR